VGGQAKVLIIQESTEGGGSLAGPLQADGYAAEVFGTPTQGLRAFAGLRPAAVLLDWALPDGSGAGLCGEIRARDPLVPILFIAAREQPGGMSRVLDAGADDFLLRPVPRAELLARLRAHLRKAEAARAPSANLISFGSVEVDLGAREARVRGRPVRLGPLEFSLLEYLSLHAGVAVSREQVLREVYGYAVDIDTERVDLLVRRLRAKLGEGPDLGGRIVAVPGYGYRLERRA